MLDLVGWARACPGFSSSVKEKKAKIVPSGYSVDLIPWEYLLKSWQEGESGSDFTHTPNYLIDTLRSCRTADLSVFLPGIC